MGKVNISGELSNTTLRANEYFRRTWKLREISYKDLDPVYFRKTRLRSCIQRMLDAINGRTIEIRTLTTDHHGAFAEDSIRALVDDLTGCLKFYIQYKQSEGPFAPRDLVSAGMDVMEPGRLFFFRSFLYLAVIRFMYTDGELSDLIDFAAEAPVYRSYREFLRNQFDQLYLSDRERRLPAPAVKRENGVWTYADRSSPEFDLYELNAGTFSVKRSRWLESVRETQNGFYGLGSGPVSENRIMQFRYLTHASDKEISLMLEDLKERHTEVPPSWIREYEEIKESYSDTDLYAPEGVPAREKELLEKSLDHFLHMQDRAVSSDVFADAVSGMTDVYTVRGGGMAISDQDSFYRIFDNLEKIERYSWDHMLPYKKEAL